MNYQESIQYLYDLRQFGAKLGLDNVRSLAGKVGSPQDGLKFIHIAGTNGKGSTCAFLESIYRHAEYKTGLFASPHLVSFRERLQVNHQLISNKEVIALVTELKPVLATFPRESHPTFFEVITIMAFMHFRNSECDIVILETGLGGRLDSTNIITPLASGITNIELDHQAWLGDTISEIAAEKAGIIKAGIPSFTCEEKPDALSVIREVANRQNSSLHTAHRDAIAKTRLLFKELPLPGEHQWKNATLARVIAEALFFNFPVPTDNLIQGLKNAHITGRFQIIQRGTQTLVLDCAHNPAGVRAFCETLTQQFPDQGASLIVGMLGDKETQSMCADLAGIADLVQLLPVHSSRSASPESLKEAFQKAAPDLSVSIAEGIQEALDDFQEAPLVAITGSIHFLGEVIEALGLENLPNERALNEYGEKDKP
ncbi:bifunctional folylpolyglutamate synthase/dihydrofolate synthase [Verrucomicrobia bacterium]|nr:bifunctional folylpolyglutamate synthase/dihydrofolate synthase [Verrucomicrobiota bacterium]